MYEPYMTKENLKVVTANQPELQSIAFKCYDAAMVLAKQEYLNNIALDGDDRQRSGHVAFEKAFMTLLECCDVSASTINILINA